MSLLRRAPSSSPRHIDSWNKWSSASIRISRMLSRLYSKMGKLFLPVLFLLAGLFIYLFWDLPSIQSLPEHTMTPSVRITDRHGRLLYEIISQTGGRNTVLSADKLPQRLKEATIAVEDKTFYSNPGIDIMGILRALWLDVRGRETLAGGSTITQQVAR